MVRYPLTLQQLLQLADVHSSAVGNVPAGLQKRQVQAVTCDSREVTDGTVFIAIPGSRFDGHAFLPEVAAAGAMLALVKQTDPSVPMAQIVVDCPASAYSQVCLKLSIGKLNPVQTVGVTGTNGKTTTTWMLQSILQAAGKQTGIIGTICHHDGIGDVESTMTTPDAKTLGELFQAMSQNQTTHCAMEISSHALAQNRAAGIQLSAAAITNVTQDHFDYHGDTESYRSAKTSITKLLYPEAPLLLNLDDEGCQAILRKISSNVPVITCGIHNRDAEICAKVLSANHQSTTVQLCLAQGDCNVRMNLVGTHNVANGLMAAGLAEQMGIRLDAIVEGLQSLSSVPGRLQPIDLGQPFQVFVDYAHTPDALRHCLHTVRTLTTGKVVCVFGAGGDRDRSKRPEMGAAASLADRCLVTSDNPRSESPEAIIADIVVGMDATTRKQAIVQRDAAIALAIQEAAAGDTVVIAGRGHESIQEIDGRLVPMDDADCARSALNALGYCEDKKPILARSA